MTMFEEDVANSRWYEIRQSMQLARVLGERMQWKQHKPNWSPELYYARQAPKPKANKTYIMGGGFLRLADIRYTFAQKSIRNLLGTYDLWKIDDVIRGRKPTKIVTLAVMRHYAREAGYELLRE